MAQKNNQKFIEQCYERSSYKEKITLEQYSEICRAPFKYVRNSIQRGDMESIMLQYLGTFKPSAAKQKYQLKALEESYKKGHITQSYYEKRKIILTKDVK